MANKRRTNFIGMYVLTLNENRNKKYQGQIVHQFDDYIVLDLFSWLTGGFTTKMVMKISDLLDENKILIFENNEEYNNWNEAFGRAYDN